MDERESYGKGLEVRRAVLGDAHVDRTLKTKTRVQRRIPGPHHALRLG